ncbi:hypothetical protein [Bradyrhizobium sp. LVM 105]|uniref:hypothetical protein n=1 Tax=Bradyrhizobium sp. LVM 105 TaxID=2341115 RepID=UPI000F80D73F|nr:hypothetical protein [Bradyrhizobium sp. LVM 105]RTE93073.1 hypothetical protein D6B98_10605 [Bradyrhizobium sp. LVM 105]
MSSARTKLNVVILDDEQRIEEAIASKLPASIGRSSVAIKPDAITDLVKELGSRAAAARLSNNRKPKEVPLDDADLFIVDYDLVKAKGEDYLTGETVAYLARCYSSCGVVIALNQFARSPTFDLTLRPQLDSFADLNIAADDLKNSGLWSKSSWKGYRAWSWPIITDAISLLEQRVADVQKTNHKTRIIDFLELPPSVVERLATSALELLGSQGSKAESATLDDLIRSPILGLRGREATDRKRQPAQDARIVAARLSAWLNLILAPQDVLVDAPHLAQRCPSLLGKTVSIASLKKTNLLDPTKTIFGSSSLAKAKFKKPFWFDRPVWFWTEIERLKLTSEIREPWNSVDDRFVFCEDTSVFKQRSAAKRFQSDLVSPYRTRHVERVAGVDYQPAHRLALG